MTQLPYQFAPPTPPIPHDRRTGLIVFGIFALVIGGMSACFAIVTPLMLVMTGALSQPPGTNVHVHNAGLDARSALSAVVVYGVVAAAFIAGGIGSIRTRRWARPLMLSVAWTWLLVGVLGMIMLAALLPSMQDMMSVSGGAATGPGFAQTLMWITLVISFIMYIVLPGVFIFFYSSPHVRETLEHYDPVPGWSDRAPVSVFTLSVALAVTALFTLSMITYAIFPLFGTMLIGPAAIGANLAASGMLLLAAYLVFRLRMSGWWLTMVISIVLPLAMIVTMRRIGIVAIYEQMGIPPEQIVIVRDNALVHGPLIPIATAVLGVAGVAYLLAVRKFFVAPAGSEARGTVASVS
ncbi:MAG TPA: hypothetical protein VGR35_07790 [Tepidisphaeraceae bacterium]|nr:hypothetical protein [Tepidisphaeraceae bacterium]